MQSSAIAPRAQQLVAPGIAVTPNKPHAPMFSAQLEAPIFLPAPAHLGAAALAPGARGFMFSDQPEAGGSVLVVAEAVGTAAAQPKTEAVFGDFRLSNSAARFGATPAVLPALAFSKVGGLPQQLQHMLHLGRGAAHVCCGTEAAMVLQSMARHGTCGERRESQGIAQRLSRNQGGQIRHKYGDAGGLLGLLPRGRRAIRKPAAEYVTGMLPPETLHRNCFSPLGFDCTCIDTVCTQGTFMHSCCYQCMCAAYKGLADGGASDADFQEQTVSCVTVPYSLCTCKCR